MSCTYVHVDVLTCYQSVEVCSPPPPLPPAFLSLGQQLVIPAHTQGTVVRVGMDSDVGVVCWRVGYSAWTYLTLEAIHLHGAAHQMC